MTVTEEIRAELLAGADDTFRAFNAKLIPGVTGNEVIGVKTPALRVLAKRYAKHPAIGSFLNDLPHRYFEEKQIHAFLIAEIKDFDECLAAVEAFLPYIDNWATCDQLSPKVFPQHSKDLLPHIDRWIASGQTYSVRFGVLCLMRYFLDADFSPEYPDRVAAIRSEEYYVNMMRAWYFATALAKQYDAILPYLQNNQLDPWTHNKTIQKACESYRVTPEQKNVLRGLRVTV